MVMSGNQPKVNLRPDDWEFPEGTSHPGQILALVEGAVVTSRLPDGTTRIIKFRKGAMITPIVERNNPRLSWDQSDVLSDTSSA